MSAPPLHLAFAGGQLLVVEEGEALRAPTADELAAALGQAVGATPVRVSLQAVEGRSPVVHDLPEGWTPPQGMALVGLRSLAGRAPDALFHAAGAALQKVEWVRSHRFCARCGTPTRRHEHHEAMACPACDQLHFPRIAPAVIVLVQRGREMLLARSPHFPPGVYSTLAGFVEAGESLEACIHREIREEVGVEVTNLRYFDSQPWPFPHSLMVGFVADWAAGEIVPDEEEIEDAGWFTPERLPPALPFRLSIARRLVDDFLARTTGRE